MNPLRILLIHGVGHKEADGTWDAEWQTAIRTAVGGIDPGVTLEFEKIPYDGEFAKARLDAGVVAEALARLLASGYGTASATSSQAAASATTSAGPPGWWPSGPPTKISGPAATPRWRAG